MNNEKKQNISEDGESGLKTHCLVRPLASERDGT